MPHLQAILKCGGYAPDNVGQTLYCADKEGKELARATGDFHDLESWIMTDVLVSNVCALPIKTTTTTTTSTTTTEYWGYTETTTPPTTTSTKSQSESCIYLESVDS